MHVIVIDYTTKELDFIVQCSEIGMDIPFP